MAETLILEEAFFPMTHTIATKATSAVPARKLAAPARPVQAPASGMGQDRLQLSRPTLKEEVASAERMMGKPVAFSSEAALNTYLKSVDQALPQGAYDPKGFLGSLGVTDVKASGREDQLTLEAVRQQKGYRPDNKVMNRDIAPQQALFTMAKNNPDFFLSLAQKANPVLEGPSRAKGKWEKPFVPAQKAVPTGETVQERYPGLGKPKLRFSADFHAGMSDGDIRYGTHTIASSLGFSDAQAKRIGMMDSGVDKNKTPYGKTSPSPMDQLDRHFNLNRDGEDTRLIWAANHLKAAIDFAKAGAFDQAETELGVGLHSLQDIFAHGQLSPSTHAVVGKFPDDIALNPIAFVEATDATEAYLKAYLKAITPTQN